MTLHQRQKDILSITIQHYIRGGDPVGSQGIHDSGFNQVSPATIRNDLKQLEDKGYLSHLHTSSGRVPTDKGYRFYIDHLMTSCYLTIEEQRHLYAHIDILPRQTQSFISGMSQLMSDMTSFTSWISSPDRSLERVQAIQLVYLSPDSISFLVLNPTGVSFECVIRTPHSLIQDDLNRLSLQLTQGVRGKHLKDLHAALFSHLDIDPKYHLVVGRIYAELEVLQGHLRKHRDLSTSGLSSMVHQPEFREPDVLQGLLHVLDKDNVYLLSLETLSSMHPFKVLIGSETERPELQHCSIVMAPYAIDKESRGMVGILGPRRMSYSTIVPFVQFISDIMTATLSTPK